MSIISIDTRERAYGLIPIRASGKITGYYSAKTFKLAEVYGPPLPMWMLDARANEANHRNADRDNHKIAKCYFVGSDVGAIKIGYSIDPKTRLISLQSGSPVSLRILALAPGGEARESAYHIQFREHRLHGEWFERHPDILAEIARLNTPSPSADSAGRAGQ